MKRSILLLPVIMLAFSVVYSQKAPAGAVSITASDLESHLSFLGSPLLKGRQNGSPELDITAGYLASQARKIGLKPVAGNSYIYPYTTIKKSLDQSKSFIQVTTDGR
jgi:hypothetical protein